MAISVAAQYGSKSDASLACCPQVPFVQLFPLPHISVQQLWQR